MPHPPLFRRRSALLALGALPWLSACGGGNDDKLGQLTSPASDDDMRPLTDLYKGEAAESVQLDPKRVHQVSANATTGHRLFRGNAPINGSTFEIEPLRAALAAAASSPLPARYRIIDVSLMNDLAEHDALEVERNHWASHADDGAFVHHPVYGSLSSPLDYPSSVRRRVERVPGLDRMEQLELRLQQLLTTPDASGLPCMIYVHCRAGRDRTGQVIAAWRLRFEGISYLAALGEANRVAQRNIVRYSRYGLMWYAFDCQDHRGITTIGTIGD